MIKYKILFAFTIILLFQLLSCSKDDTQPEIKLGSKYQGGTVFYILKSGDPSYIEGETHGFIAYEKTLDTKYIWAKTAQITLNWPKLTYQV